MNPERFGHYTLIQPLGKGGMAEVFLARAPSSMGFEKLLAIKRLLPPFCTDKHIISMLGDEARLSVWLNHPSIVQVFDFGRVGKTYFIAMEYVDGCDLCQLIRPTGRTPGRPLPLGTALYVMVQLAGALDYAHRRTNKRGEPLGIIHRDVSPHNVLISRKGAVKLADFGLARASISVHHSHAGIVRGKFSYMPKEQARGLKIDHRIDLFAAGVTFYEMLTGRKPYTSSNLAQQLFQLEQTVPPPSQLVSTLPEEIDDIVMQAMSPNVEERYSTAADLACDLQDALSKRSNASQESQNLARLAQQMTGEPLSNSQQLPAMSLVELVISQESLISEDILAARQASSSPPHQEEAEKEVFIALGEAIPTLEDEEQDEEWATTEYVSQDQVGLTSPANADFGLDNVPPQRGEPAGARRDLRTSATKGPRKGQRDKVGSDQAVPADRSLPIGEAHTLDSSPPWESRPHLPEAIAHASSRSPDIDPGFAPEPDATIRDPEEAGQLAQAALEDAPTIQRTPDEARASIQRAMARREQEHESTHSSSAGRRRTPTDPLGRQQPLAAPQNTISEATEEISHRKISGVALFPAPSAMRAPETWLPRTALGWSLVLLLLGAGIGIGWWLQRTFAAAAYSPVERRTAHLPCPPPPPCPKPAPCPRSLPSPSSLDHTDAEAVDDLEDLDDQEGSDPVGMKRPRTHKTRTAGQKEKQRGFLTVVTNVPAKVYIDNRTFAVQAPLNDLSLSPGMHRVRIQSEKKRRWKETQRILIKPGERIRLSIVFQ